MDRIPEEKLAEMLKEAATQITVGANYVHYKKQDIYKVTGLAIIEATDEVGVIYEAQYGEQISFIRPLSSWLEQVEWNGHKTERFKKA